LDVHRSSAPARLLDWSGQWEIRGQTPNAAGGFEQSVEEAVAAARKWGPPPYTPLMQPKIERFETFRERRRQDTIKNGPSGVGRPLCSWGVPLVMLFSPLMFEILPTPKETVLVFSGREVRHVYTDGRPHTAKEDLWPTYWGDSIGHWEGETLVIDTIAVQSPLMGDVPVIPILAFGGDATEAHLVAMLSREAHFVERIRMTGKELENDMTIFDPVMFSAPWHISRRYERVAHVNRMIHEDCSGEDRNPIVNGQYTLAPPPPPPQLSPELAELVQAVSGAASK
jgi:hypothetical protein